MVARALLLRPHLIVADEPVSMVDASLRATILGSLRQLNQERGISIIYITHDLATAYQVADNIIVLYRASVAEAGDVELVVKAPKHPYTQLLIASIPQVSTERTWLTMSRGGAAGPNRETAAASSSRAVRSPCRSADDRCRRCSGPSPAVSSPAISTPAASSRRRSPGCSPTGEAQGRAAPLRAQPGLTLRATVIGRSRTRLRRFSLACGDLASPPVRHGQMIRPGVTLRRCTSIRRR